MSAPTSLNDIDLSLPTGRTYLNLTREWHEEFIYFLMVDRFHDDTSRQPVLGSNRSQGVLTPDDFYGGKIRGITRNLDYVAGLGCTAIWLSPIFENNQKSYHGYDIVPEYIDECQRTYPHAAFTLRNVFVEGIEGIYDTLSASMT